MEAVAVGGIDRPCSPAGIEGIAARPPRSPATVSTSMFRPGIRVPDKAEPVPGSSSRGDGEPLHGNTSHSAWRFSAFCLAETSRACPCDPGSLPALLTHSEALMLPNYRHAPIVDPLRKRCPVCNHAVYSLAGIHPQCAVSITDLPRTTKKKPAPSTTETSNDVVVLKPAVGG